MVEYLDEFYKDGTSALKRFKEVEAQYLARFGENSLERILAYPVPSNGPCSAEWLEKFTITMNAALDANKALPQIDEEKWNEYIF